MAVAATLATTIGNVNENCSTIHRPDEKNE